MFGTGSTAEESSGIDVGVLQQLVEAVQISQAANVPEATRKQAEEFCLKFKDRERKIVDYASVLVNTNNSDHVRHFGFFCIEEFIKNKWSAVEQPRRDQVKQLMLNLLSQGTKPRELEAFFIKSKLAAIMVQIALREWPQNWPNMLDMIVQIGSTDITREELVYLILRILSDEISQFSNNIPDQRRKELIQGLNATLPLLLPFVQSRLAEHLQRIDSSTSAENAAHVALAKSIDEICISVFEWAPTNAYFEYHLHDAMIYQLRNPLLRMTACESLLLVAEKKLRPETANLAGEIFDKLNHTIPLAIQGVTDDDYDFLKRLSQMIGALGSTFFPAIENDQNRLVPYLQNLLLFSTHPSLLLSSFAIPVWVLVLKSPSIQERDYILGLLGEVFKFCDSKIMKAGDPNYNNPIARYSAEDFDSHEEYLQFFGVFRNRLIEMIRLVSYYMPYQSLQFVIQKLQAILESSKSIPSGSKITVHSPAYIAWEGFNSELSAVILGMDDLQKKADDPVVSGRMAPCPPLLEEILKLVLSWEPEDPLIFTRVMQCVQTLSPYLKFYAHYIQTVVEKMFNYVQYRTKAEASVPLDKLSADTISCRKKACLTLVHLGQDIPGYLVSILPNMCHQIQDLYQSGKILDQERVILSESLFRVSNELKDYASKQSFLQSLLGGPLEQLAQACAGINPSNMPEFCMRFGIQIVGMPPFAPEALAAHAQMRTQINFALNMFQIAARRVKMSTDSATPTDDQASRHPLTDMFAVYIPVISGLFSCLLALWHPECRVMISPESAEIYQLTYHERAAILGDTNTEEQTTTSGGVYSSRSLNIWLTHVYDSILASVAAFVANTTDLYNIPGFSQMFLTNFFQGLIHTSDRNIERMWRNLIVPLVFCCPEKNMRACLLEILQYLLQVSRDRLILGWQRIETIASGGTVDANSAKEEIVFETSVRKLNRAVFESLDMLLSNPLQPKADQKASDQVEDPDDFTTAPTDSVASKSKNAHVQSFFTSTPEVITPVLVILQKAFTWPDSSTVSRAMAIGNAIFPEASNIQQLHGYFSVDLLGTLLYQILSGRYPNFHHDFLTIIRDICFRYTPYSNNLERILCQIPNTHPKMIREFISNLQKELNDKKQKMIIRKFFTEQCRIQIGEAKKETNIRNLPQKLYILKKLADQNDLAETSDDLEIQSLFKR